MKQAVFLLAGTFGVGIIIYTAKSLYTQVIKLKRRSGIISSIDYLLNQITEQKGKLKGLQYYQRMLIIGRPQIMDLQSPSLLAIFRQKNYNECDPIFKFNSSFKQHILVNDFNQNLQSIQRKELELSQFCECQKIEFNPQNVKYVLFGDFIYNPDNNLLRCTRIREFSSFWYHCRSRSSKELFHRLLILLKLGTIVGLIYFLIVLYKNLQQMQESNAKKGFNPQYSKFKFKHHICLFENHIYINLNVSEKIIVQNLQNQEAKYSILTLFSFQLLLDLRLKYNGLSILQIVYIKIRKSIQYLIKSFYCIILHNFQITKFLYFCLRISFEYFIQSILVKFLGILLKLSDQI